MDGTPEAVEAPEITDWDAAAYLRKRVPQAQYSRRSYDRIFYRNCTIGSTKIPCLDGVERTIKEIADAGLPVWIYGFDLKTMRYVPAKMEKAWSNGAKECVEVFFEEGTSVICTPDHRLLTWNGYVEAKDLKPGDSLVPFYSSAIGNQKNKGNPYDVILQPADVRRESVHRMVAIDQFGEIPKKFHVDHINQNKRDNRPENLQILSPNDHAVKTMREMSEESRRKHKFSINLFRGEAWEGLTESERQAYWANIHPNGNGAGQLRPKQKRSINAFWSAMSADERKEFVKTYLPKPDTDGLRKYWASLTEEQRQEKYLSNLAFITKARLAKKGLPQNHRVKCVVPAGMHEVFDAYVPRTNNFAISSGIVMHNCLFYLGQQWLRFSRTAQQWKPIQLPDWFPKQVTNLFAVACDLMKSVFMQSDPQSVYTPASSDAADIAAARVAPDISRFINVEVGQSQLESQAAAWLVTTGNFFIIDGYDNDESHGTKFVADMMCLDCARHIPAEESGEGCPMCGGANLMEARDESGQAMGQELPVGQMYSEVCGPFEIHFDLVAGEIDKSPYIYRARTYPVEVLKDMFPEAVDDIKPDDAGIDSGMFYQTALAYVTNGTSSTPGNYGGSAGSVDNVPRATLYHLWVRPTKALPDGGEALIIGERTLWKSTLVAHDEKDKPFVPVTHVGFNKVAGRVFAKTPADDAVYQQVQINMTEAFVQLAIQRTSNPTWLLPKGIGIDAITGEPGEKIWYSSMLGAKPERVGGAEVPGSVFRWLDSRAKAMQDLTHTQDVMRGKAPEGVPTLGGAQLLLERGLAGFADGLKSWGRGWNQSRRNRLNIWREYCAAEKTVMVLGKNQSWEAKKFTKADLAGHITCYLEEASIAPKSKAYDQLMISQMIDKQMIDLRDPEQRIQAFTKFDQPDFIGALDLNVKDAVKEQEDFLKTGQWRPRPGIDDDAVHNMEHLKFNKSEEFFALPPQAQQAAIQHTLYHQQNLQKAAEAAQANDPHILNAKAKMAQLQMELQGDKQHQDMEIEHLRARNQINLQAHGLKKGVDVALDAKKRAADTAAAKSKPQPTGTLQ